jgi:hypothetical protein
MTNETKIKVLKIGIAAVVLLVLAAVSATMLNNVIATPVSPREVAIRSWVNDMGTSGLTAKRQEAQSQLEKAGEEAVPALMTALRSNNVNIRSNAADVLGYIASPTSTQALNDAVSTDTSTTVRANAAWALGEIKNASALPTLERVSVLDTSELVRSNANDSISSIQDAVIQRAGRNLSDLNVIATVSNQPNSVYLASGRDLLISHDNGTQWDTLKQTLPSAASSLTVNPVNPNIIFAGMYSLGMVLSTDGGHTWQSLTRNFSNQALGDSTVTAITVDPANPMRVVMAHGIRVGGTDTDFFPLGILFSNDGGKTWGDVMDLQQGQEVTRLEIQNGKVYALTSDKVLITPLAD